MEAIPMSVPAAPEGVAHESARLHVSGEADYVDDIAVVAGTLHAAPGLSERAHARIRAPELEAVRRQPGVVAVLTAADIPGINDCGAVVADEPILADGEVRYVGQPVFLVVADSAETARRAARAARIDYEALPARLDLAAARDKLDLVLPPMQLRRGDPQAALAAAPHRLVAEWRAGGQEHFYLEGQVSYCLPVEDGGLHLWCSTQHPSEVQKSVARCLATTANRIVVEVRRLGGGFGGKEAQATGFACLAALAAWKLRRPVKLRLDRDDDMCATGKRHEVLYRLAAGYDDSGRILAADVEMALNAGHCADLSGAIATRAACHVDNAYFLPHVDIRALCCRTNLQSSTAFRGFGAPQAALATEYLIDTIARRLDEDPLAVRRRNFYGGEGRDLTPYGQRVVDNVLESLVAELEASSEYRLRRDAVRAFNADSPVLRKGLALTPVKFGISFNLSHLNQAGALVHLYTDGSVLLSHGGTEMGQGVHTKVAQVVARTLGVSLSVVRIAPTDVSRVANTSATAASTGTDLNGKAAEAAARRIRERLAAVAAAHFGVPLEAVGFAEGRVRAGDAEMSIAALARLAHRARVQLWSDGFYATPSLHWDEDSMTGHPFYYFAYGAAVSEVVIDSLTGEWRVLRADLLHDAGASINPAIDRGQVEGGFIQGMGWLTMEELRRDAEGRLLTHSPSTYKIPGVSDCPPDFRVRLYPNPNREDTILRSKAVGEPPFLLGISVFLAIRDAIASFAPPRVAPPLRAPATPEAILDAIEAARAGAGV
ncbi:xanthine dehydrogenase molybdopterin binding subunit [Thauera phenolivorans]|uniref:xanthine dehydrogenase molybdopterin binding subunit n=1 Tax=Thauera phenolivorans TaxID=1792543 RepID=UPI00083A7FD2|nr:xanthine dehydrogenase molybdopterin binding subunit [Thauera phenolivorans]